jgi:hypothetical protein
MKEIYTQMNSTSEFTHEFFEEASRMWKANKVRYGQAMYKYKKAAFPVEKEEPVRRQTQASKRRTGLELQKRQSIDEPAPLPTRKSERLRQKHIQETYA